jgi:hypothetical protein
MLLHSIKQAACKRGTVSAYSMAATEILNVLAQQQWKVTTVIILVMPAHLSVCMVQHNFSYMGILFMHTIQSTCNM